jgi:hypothetical protein
VNGIQRVEFYQAGTPNALGVRTTAPYVLPLTNVAGGTYVFTAVAVDTLNKRTVSLLVTVSVASRNRVNYAHPLSRSRNCGDSQF